MRHTPSVKRLSLAFIAAMLLIVALGLASDSAEALTKTFYWEKFDVAIILLENGDLDITEDQTIVFNGGDFTFGYATINKNNLDDISNITVREGDRVFTESSSNAPYTFEVEESSDSITINWYFPPTQGTHTYTFGYTVEGGTRVEETGDQVLWMAIPQDVPGRIDNSTVTISTPPNVPILSTYAAINDSVDNGVISSVSADGRKATFETERSLFGDTLVTGIRFEHGLLALSAPAWQGAEQRVDVLNLIFIVLALLILVGGPLLVLLLWQARGRDPEVGLVADYLSEPPSDLRPGIAGALVDEKADMRDVVATVIDLARRGYIVIREESGDHIFTRTEKPLDGIRPYEKKIVDKFFGKKTERKLADLRYKFSSALPSINKAMYDELVHEKLVPVSPDKVRTNYGCWTFIAATIGFFMFLVPASLTGADTAVCLGLAFIPATIALAYAGRHMPVKTEKGALEAAKWDAFKSYLKDIERYTDLNEATEIFEQYLPYAIAFGLQNSWINKFSAVKSTPVPTWYGPMYYPRPYSSGPTRPSTGGVGGGSMPSLDTMSGGLTGGLTSMSTGLTKMLNSTSSVMKSTQPSSSSSGGGSFSGGFSGGGFSGGGGRGFG